MSYAGKYVHRKALVVVCQTTLLICKFSMLHAMFLTPEISLSAKTLQEEMLCYKFLNRAMTQVCAGATLHAFCLRCLKSSEFRTNAKYEAASCSCLCVMQLFTVPQTATAMVSCKERMAILA